MNEAVKQTLVYSTDDVLKGLKKLREPFPPHQISKLPKGTKAQNECPNDQKRNCSLCGGWHHPQIKHLDYVGHAALTDRLLDADMFWSWEPLAYDEQGLPRFDSSGGLWIKLIVCGLACLGYGNAEAKTYMDKGAREKEVIGDALRNAAMRRGAALELWHKGELHKDDPVEAPKITQDPVDQAKVSNKDGPEYILLEAPKITQDPVDQAKVSNAVTWFKEMIDADQIEENWQKVKDGWGRLSPNEQMQVDANLRDKAPNCNSLYKNLLKKYLEYVPVNGP